MERALRVECELCEKNYELMENLIMQKLVLIQL
jgi:hypothetical protein